MTLQLVLLIAGALLGELVSWLVIWWRAYWQNRKRPQLVGRWHSMYRSDFRDETNVIREEIDVSIHLGTIRMENRNNPSEDDYVVEAKVVNNGHLVGSWKSLKDGAHATGTVILIVNPLGNLMYGFFTGLGHTGEKTYCGWILARRTQDLPRGVDLLRNAVLALPDSTSAPAGPRTNKQ